MRRPTSAALVASPHSSRCAPRLHRSPTRLTGSAGTGGVELNPQVKAATQTLSLAFLHHVFGQGDAGALALWAERHRTILAKFVAMKGASA